MSEEIERYDIKNQEKFTGLSSKVVEVIFSFIDHCAKWEIDQVSFEFFDSLNSSYLLISMGEYRTHWDIVVENVSDKRTTSYQLIKE